MSTKPDFGAKVASNPLLTEFFRHAGQVLGTGTGTLDHNEVKATLHEIHRRMFGDALAEKIAKRLDALLTGDGEQT